ncbi:MAG TPA: hypothetical protein VGV63_06030 [Acidimicrobiales bacterium]|nr:hypothetical protein [Acidimicrobiales bacterium]
MTPAKKRAVSDEQKAAMAEGRAQSRSIAPYLEALEAHKPKRGRKRTPESIDKRIAAIDRELEDANQIKRLSLVQERLDLLEERENLQRDVDLSQYEDDFVENAKSYGERKGISYQAWRELGVPAAVLKRAGITRAGS